MNLTPQDLQAIRSAVREEVKQEVSGQIQTQVRQVVRQEIKQETSQQLKPVKEDLNKVKKSVDTLIKYFDKQDILIQKRLNRLDDHLGLPPLH